MSISTKFSNAKSNNSTRGKAYDVASIISLVVLGLFCNLTSFSSISRFGKRLSPMQKEQLYHCPKLNAQKRFFEYCASSFTKCKLRCSSLKSFLLILIWDMVLFIITVNGTLSNCKLGFSLYI